MAVPAAPSQQDDVDTFNTFWREVDFTTAMRPRMLEDEVEVLITQEVTVLHNERTVGYGKGSVTLTTHRVIWQPAEGGDMAAPIAGGLGRVARADVAQRTFKKSSKVSLYLRNQLNGGEEPEVKLRFHHRGRDAFLEKVTVLLEREAWKPKVADASLTKPSADDAFSTTSAGIKGIIRQQERLRNAEKRVVNAAFSDLDSLIAKAKDVVQVIERFSQEKGAAAGADHEKLSAIVQSLGVSSPVTRELAGGAFHAELAREMADVLGPLVERLGSVLTLPDVYCLVNRARGTELCSPEDILKAAKLMGGLGLEFALREFDSGLLALQHTSHRDEQLRDRVTVMAEELHALGQGLRAMVVARELRCSVTLAAQYLELAEQAGRLARDEGPEGLQFYPNLFPAFVAARELDDEIQP
uniref:Vacuolar protein-sorting-associated protein 36 n=1 Tax=Phaeomonas parva TaxID=124430 RepID=A0A7S1UEX9_9STRA|mmetsp:Transcript_41581/g.130233  ORF Transcript_41581/g.130233 Transcript_41581/m.130233 type:complete len:412 (+) Transcript_41581:106-1341(+)|eukprot:CAMPEP_0118861300 /NCGR_PEP_ID=MMETSP1163-20130328/6879_1 /TAXON_ID=124430 /ORGANISM="Phaeomonas parva, Strain CCMP2877" /LENGTH=411 /DNA_ID=CAMNT_0006795103 /DNA_START=111 /DNA_END=1346 /DNA_ORIENTATION=+